MFISKSALLGLLAASVSCLCMAKQDLPTYVTTGHGDILAYTAPGVATPYASGLGNPAGLAVDRKGNVYVSESVAPNRILKFTEPGVFSVLGTLPYAGGMAFDGCGNLYVVGGGGNGVVMMYPPSGAPKVFASGLYQPVHVAVDADQNVYVTLAGTYPNGLDGAVLKFTAPNTFTVFASGLNNARSIAVDSEANVYVVENNAAGDIRRYTAPGSYTVFAAPFSYPYGVGVDEEDTVWIADASNLYTATAPQGQTVYASGLFYPTQFGFRVGLKHSKECKDR